jgi:hypothetical protein
MFENVFDSNETLKITMTTSELVVVDGGAQSVAEVMALAGDECRLWSWVHGRGKRPVLPDGPAPSRWSTGSCFKVLLFCSWRQCNSQVHTLINHPTNIIRN